ncbi:Glyoxylate/hydroxypyruvate reductase A [Thalassovita gelatinovora]|uniref:Glyoxylate/hydroxypyruvate reductase A n=1 Tax=Thalassovita gelatinovora TaxID=53501 RepID=A0A0P1FC98_THAGE|nr:glyoxylate/hydroxypyruvate reductase A [Thalassovita gelatinovora]QIZ80453.1 glyoxylate/hydroxypyruvate reductase A [Thalassovita gelatinovora]CUH65867.1 Glyoxylate/hydroxypyruvate reductase A [Thalassovita gelatinovora]SEQ72903.1 glyoxylate/hydroxypyruvate reductase A [Thalassovita gelatinovora]
MIKDRRSGIVATCSALDLMALYEQPFLEFAPEIDLIPPEAVSVPEAVEYVLTWKPEDDAFVPYPNLRAVFSIAAGIDGILECPSLPDVPVFRVEDPDQAQQMAGFAAFHVVWHHRDMGAYLKAQKSHSWQRDVGKQSPRHKRIGIMGFGLMGRAIGKGLTALGYDVTTLSRRPPTPAEPGMRHMTTDQTQSFLAGTDILINVMPLTPETQGILNRDLFAALPKGAVLIQMGRGAQLIESDLLDALESGQISGASLDVFGTEPLPPESPLWDHPKLFLTPHVASTPEAAAVVRSVRAGLSTLSQNGLTD